MSQANRDLLACGCCEGVKALTPAAVSNVPGLSALAYRVGTHGRFKSSMLAALSRQPGLRGLTVRDDDDGSVALMDAWAAVLDILSFYQERIANEGFLRTATERQSVLELARAIGYELRPGVAAATHLSFILEEALGDAATAAVASGTKAQSVPGQDELPQMFETVEALIARAQWNTLNARRTVPQILTAQSRSVYLKGDDLGLDVGDRLLFVGEQRRQDRTSERWKMRTVREVDVDHDAKRTRVFWRNAFGGSLPTNPHVYALRTRASIFGHNAADWRTLPDEMKASYLGLSSPDDIQDHERDEWPGFTIFSPVFPPQYGPYDVDLDPVYDHPTVEHVAEAIKTAAVEAANTVVNSAVQSGMTVVAEAGNVVNVAADVAEKASLALTTVGTVATDAVTGPIDSVIQTQIVALENLQTTMSNLGQGVVDAVSAVLPTASYTSDESVFNWDILVDENAVDENARSAFLNQVSGKIKDDIENAISSATDVQDKVEEARKDAVGVVTSTLTRLSDQLTLGVNGLSDAVAAGIGQVFDPSILATLSEATTSSFGALAEASESVTRAAAASTAAGAVVTAIKAAMSDILQLTEATPESIAAVGTNAALAAVAAAPGLAAAGSGVLGGGAAAAIVGHQVLGPAATTGATMVYNGVTEAIQQSLKVVEHPPAARARQPTRMNNRIDLDAVYPKVVVGDAWLVLSTPTDQELYQITTVSEASRAEFLLSGKTTRVTLNGERLNAFASTVRDATIFAQGERLELAEAPFTEPVRGSTVTLDKRIDELETGRLLIVSGSDDAGNRVGELAVLRAQQIVSGLTRLALEAPLMHDYARDSVEIHANVAPATHGETREETLGSGDAARAFQRFVLRESPMTYVPAATASGTETTLEIRVNDLLWHEIPSLYNAGPDDKVYTTRIYDDGHVSVQFGDGVNGARIPTGIDNVTARYRVGIGLDGNVDRETISLLMTRALGVNGVVNPLAASGAADPEKLADARRNAPLTVLTMDRIVSLRDFEDFARGFAGIGKAQAAEVWDGTQQRLHLTVAGIDGEPVSAEMRANLLDAINAASEIRRQLTIDSYRPLSFDLQASVDVGDNFLAELVFADIRSALTTEFGFARRSFGQAVTAGELLAVIQKIDGVTAVKLGAPFNVAGAPTRSRLPAALAGWNAVAAAIVPAELLTIAESGITLDEVSL